ncbi:MAG: 5-oxoprolinase subunit PxpB [Variovorax sp.]
MPNTADALRPLACSALGESALVCTLPPPATLAQQQAIWALAQEVRDWPHVKEAVPGMNNLTLLFDAREGDAAELEARVRHVWPSLRGTALSRRSVEIPVHYGGEAGPDLAHVAAHTGLAIAEVVRRHAAGDYTVFMLGFLPGFAFMGGLAPELATPRRAEPRTQVPAGSVGIGGEQTGIYPMPSPGGWQLIGRTALSLFDAEAEAPTLLRPGDSVRFVAERIDS